MYWFTTAITTGTLEGLRRKKLQISPNGQLGRQRGKVPSEKLLRRLLRWTHDLPKEIPRQLRNRKSTKVGFDSQKVSKMKNVRKANQLPAKFQGKDQPVAGPPMLRNQRKSHLASEELEEFPQALLNKRRETNHQSGNAERVGQINSVTVLLGRLMWILLGPPLLSFTTYAIVAHGGWFTTRDAAYGAVVVLMIGGRWVEQRSGAATTATGEPATIEDFKRYVRILLPVAAAIWGAANVLGNHILG